MAQDSSRPDFWETRYQDRFTPWDAGGVPPRLAEYVQGLGPGARVLIPGCGSGHEVQLLAEAGCDVLAIDFSAAAVELARGNLGRHADRIVHADFFAFDLSAPFDLVYERAFLCALPRKVWSDYAKRMAEVLRPGGSVAGFWFYDVNPKGPPFGTSEPELCGLMGTAFERTVDEPVSGSIPVFEGKERWQVWRRR
jgi:SAM-dependent methyltransferase